MKKDSSKIYETEKCFLENLAKAYTNYDVNYVKDFIAENVTYDSVWVLEQITNKSDYIDYLEKKLEAMNKTSTLTDFKMAYTSYGKPYLIFAPKNTDPFACFSVEAENNIIKAIHVVPISFYAL